MVVEFPFCFLEGPGMGFNPGNTCPQASQTCGDRRCDFHSCFGDMVIRESFLHLRRKKIDFKLLLVSRIGALTLQYHKSQTFLGSNALP